MSRSQLPNCHSIMFKPIFYWKLCLRRLPNTSESDTNNMKSTWPTREFCIGDPTPPIFHLLALGVGIGGWGWGLGLGVGVGGWGWGLGLGVNFSVCIGGSATSF